MEGIDASTRIAIDALVTEFSFRIDHHEATRVPELFTEDGTFESPLATLNGREAITAAMAQRAQANYNTRHAISNLRLQRHSPDRISGTVLLILYRWAHSDPDPQPHQIALVEYEDVYKQNNESEWLFASRRAMQVLPTK
ncbi:MAG: hypothetical protein ACI96M_003372 [Candidatus Azotimanducaceae bacterium]|jgi:hypothetical protein